MADNANRYPANLQANLTPGAQVSEIQPLTWRLNIPAGKGGRYRLAQLDDYAGIPRHRMAWKTGTRLSLEARASAKNLPGTWGFGLWNDPFSMGVFNPKGPGSFLRQLRWPALPNTAWFFFASPPSYLSLREDLPATGGLASTFRSNIWAPSVFFPLAVLFPLLMIPAIMRLARRCLRTVIKQTAFSLEHDPCDWHRYEIIWKEYGVDFRVNGESVLSSQIIPKGPLGLVIWIDNQYLALPPDGRLMYGMLPNLESGWIEVRHLQIEQGR